MFASISLARAGYVAAGAALVLALGGSGAGAPSGVNPPAGPQAASVSVAPSTSPSVAPFTLPPAAPLTLFAPSALKHAPQAAPQAAPLTRLVPESDLAWGPSQQQFDAAAAAVAKMSTAQKAGQVLVQFYAGTDPAAAVDRTERLHLAGTIVMGDNVPTTSDGVVDVKSMAQINDRLSTATRADGRDWPAVLGVDQEGGLVARLRAPLTEWPTPMTYGAAGNPELAKTAQLSMNTELAAVGFTMNYAPLADVTIGAKDPTIRARSYSEDPAVVGAMTTGAMHGAIASGVLPVLKHFPGHGSVTTDSHLDLPVQKASLQELQQRDWRPFSTAIDAGAPMVMMAHIAVTELDPGVPASVSPAGYQALRDLGFAGVAVTDALNMAAIAEKYPAGEAAARALAAGADLLLMPADVEAAHAAITAAIADGSIPAERLDQAATRVVALLKWQQSVSEPVPLDAVGSHEAESRDASAAALTVLTGQCGEKLIDTSVRVSGGTEQDRQRFRAAADERGIDTASGPVVKLVTGAAGNSTAGDIEVSLGGPWALAASDAEVRIALYGRTPGAFDALLDFMTGEAPAPGALPVDVGTFERGTGCE